MRGTAKITFKAETLSRREEKGKYDSRNSCSQNSSDQIESGQ